MSSETFGQDPAVSVSLPSRPRHGTSAMKQQRILACVQCQQRKIKCNREFPCVHCVKNNVQCVPANLVPKPRKRRFAERELLDRLRQYESLLKKHQIDFDPLHSHSTDVTKKELAEAVDDTRVDGEGAETRSQAVPPVSSPSNFWSAITQTPSAEDDTDRSSGNESDFNVREMGERMIRKAWDHPNYRKEDLIFGTPLNDINLTLFHPDPAQIFKLWQLYLDNVDPLLKVTHTPTLQPRIIDAIGNLSKVGPALNSLLFAIYCIAITSLQQDETWTPFATNKGDMMSRFQFACQQSLLQANFLRTEDMDCLTALYLYMISIKPDIDTRSLASSLGMTIRIALRMGLHDESTYGKYSILEGELRRRLWWSLTIFDNRICEMSNDLKSNMLLPTWNCKTSSNFNDFDLRVETKVAPRENDEPSQAIFTVVRTQIADYLRNCTWYLDFNNPALKALVRKSQPSLEMFEKHLESRYLSKCNPDDPLHMITIWTARGLMAKNRLWAHLSKFPRPTSTQPDTSRDEAVYYAMQCIECDTQLLSSPLTQRFNWFTKAYSFFPANIHVIQDLRKRPLQKHASRAWEVMSRGWEARHHQESDMKGNPFFTMFSSIVISAWEARETAIAQQGGAREPLPGLVTEMYGNAGPRQSAGSVGSGPAPAVGGEAGFEQGFGVEMGMNLDDFLSTLMPMAVDSAGRLDFADGVG